MSDLDRAQVQCPYCGEQIDIQLDVISGDEEYVEDCAVCCRPIVIRVERDEDGLPSVSARAESE